MIIADGTTSYYQGPESSTGPDLLVGNGTKRKALRAHRRPRHRANNSNNLVIRLFLVSYFTIM
eukprot:COSAG02_NODE_362_length_23815_cov_27.096981_5_plen_63_part_00